MRGQAPASMPVIHAQKRSGKWPRTGISPRWPVPAQCRCCARLLGYREAALDQPNVKVNDELTIGFCCIPLPVVKRWLHSVAA
jgi:hypothetical protein